MSKPRWTQKHYASCPQQGAELVFVLSHGIPEEKVPLHPINADLSGVFPGGFPLSVKEIGPVPAPDDFDLNTIRKMVSVVRNIVRRLDASKLPGAQDYA
ncbi:MAG: hypothetical protein M1476_03725 [Candidatus Thermoplasmatota archaeon]|nr:hypothetical protein [Candidatus Thermoplasmatota archaeon]